MASALSGRYLTGTSLAIAEAEPWFLPLKNPLTAGNVHHAPTHHAAAPSLWRKKLTTLVWPQLLLDIYSIVTVSCPLAVFGIPSRINRVIVFLFLFSLSLRFHSRPFFLFWLASAEYTLRKPALLPYDHFHFRRCPFLMGQE